MTVLVTGASGHLGLTLIPKLVAAGRKVRAVDLNKNRTIEAMPVEFILADTREPDSLEAAFQGVEVVFHLAAYISIHMDEWPILEATNIQGVRNVVSMCQKYKVKRLVHCSSIEALSVEPRDKPITEDNSLVPADFPIPYPRSKAAGQRIVLQAIADGLNAVILYPTGIIGPNDYGFRATNQALLAVANGDMPMIPRYAYDFVDVRDVADGAMAAEQKAQSGASYILGNDRLVLSDLAREVARIAGVHEPRPSPGWTARAARPFIQFSAALRHKRSLVTRASLYPITHSHTISHERATRDLGYQPRPIQETLRDTVKWFQEIGKIKTR